MAAKTDPGITRFPETHCLACGTRLDSVGTSDGAPGKPDDGAPCACIRCGAVMAFDGKGGLRRFTEREMDEIEADPELMDDMAALVGRIHLLWKADA